MIKDRLTVDQNLCDRKAFLAKRREELELELEHVAELQDKVSHAIFLFHERGLNACFPNRHKCLANKRNHWCDYRDRWANCNFTGGDDELPCEKVKLDKYDLYSAHCDDVYDRWSESCTR